MVSSPSNFIPILFFLVSVFLTTVSSLTCSTQKLTGTKVYPNCMDLPALNSYLHYTYDATNSSLSVVFIASPPVGGWISWGINPNATGMAGTQAIVAFKNDTVMAMKTLDIKSYKVLIPGKLSFDVWDLKAEEDGGLMKIFATVKVPVNVNAVNHVWQVGPTVTAGMIGIHDFQPQNLNSKGRLSLNGGGADDVAPVDFETKKKYIHGVLNTLSWGFLFPIGVIMARYVKAFPSADPAWFYLHVGCQLSAYVLGVAGWGTGMKLGSESEGIVFTGHRKIGIAVFCLATIQVFALFLRPKPDHKYRFYWNIYHHSFGYTIIILGILNIFRGFGILNPDPKWKSAYTLLIIALAVIALVLEAITWTIVMKRNCKNSNKTNDGYNNN